MHNYSLTVYRFFLTILSHLFSINKDHLGKNLHAWANVHEDTSANVIMDTVQNVQTIKKAIVSVQV